MAPITGQPPGRLRSRLGNPPPGAGIIAAIPSEGKSFCQGDSGECDALGPGNWCRRQWPENPWIGGKGQSPDLVSTRVGKRSTVIDTEPGCSVSGVSEPDAVNRSARRCRTSASPERLGDSEGGQDAAQEARIQALAQLAALLSANIVLPNTDGREIRLRRVAKPNAEQQRLLDGPAPVVLSSWSR